MDIREFSIIDSTLREGEQFAGAHFTSDQKVAIARALDDFGVEYIELTSPAASPQSFRDAEMIGSLGLRAKVLVHIRCTMEDATLAVETGVDGVNMLCPTSAILREHSHGEGLEEIEARVARVAGYVRRQGLEVRLSAEDSFRTDPADLYRVYAAAEKARVDRVGLADTVGVATPHQVHRLVSRLRRRLRVGIEFHGHNDSGCAVANAYAALEAGATHIDTTVLGIGERNGITPLGGLVARLYATEPALVRKYRLEALADLDQLVAGIAGVEVPFNNCITGATAFTHRAGIHTKAVLSDPRSYEILDPADFGLGRTIEIAHRLTGWNAIAHRAAELGLPLSDGDLRDLSVEVKEMADDGPIGIDMVDNLLRRRVERLAV